MVRWHALQMTTGICVVVSVITAVLVVVTLRRIRVRNPLKPERGDPRNRPRDSSQLGDPHGAKRRCGRVTPSVREDARYSFHRLALSSLTSRRFGRRTEASIDLRGRAIMVSAGRFLGNLAESLAFQLVATAHSAAELRRN